MNEIMNSENYHNVKISLRFKINFLLFVNRGIIHKNAISEGWSTIFPGSDRSVVLRSQRFLYEKEKQRPVQIQTYITFQ